LERSGFLKLMQFLNQGLMKQKEKQVAQDTAWHLRSTCSELERELKDKHRIVPSKDLSLVFRANEYEGSFGIKITLRKE